MSSAEELDSMGRILIAIETYRHQTDDQTDLLGNEFIHVYLKHHLSRQDWRVWNQFRVNQTASSDPVPQDGSLWHTQEFKQLLGQYKRAVHERIHVWPQEKSNLF
ncbi:hypothetical protein [Spirosoma flavum]|uniref:Uncharacterized protein n=1 Tax=Spirosoma flavum TaxID=2048557 RepID=A0ABW6AUD5_9BACT